VSDVVRRARALIGVRFRPQGRDRQAGLDCIGVVAMAFGLTAVRRDYGLRSGDAVELNGEFAASGFLPIAATQAGPGDVLLVQAGHRQLHVVILTPEGYLHADAGLRRVVEVPTAVAWPVVGAWRHPENGAGGDQDPPLRRLSTGCRQRNLGRLRPARPLPRAGEG